MIVNEKDNMNSVQHPPCSLTIDVARGRGTIYKEGKPMSRKEDGRQHLLSVFLFRTCKK